MTQDTLLFRQVNPSWIKSGRITSQVFRPTRKDSDRLSVYDGDQITAEGSWRHYTGELGHLSVGVVAVTVIECERRELPVKPDADAFPEHVTIAFDGLSRAQVVKKAKHLTRAAETRGWQYRARAE